MKCVCYLFLNHYIHFGVAGRVLEPMSGLKVLKSAFWGFSTFFKGTSAVPWGCPGTPCLLPEQLPVLFATGTLRFHQSGVHLKAIAGVCAPANARLITHIVFADLDIWTKWLNTWKSRFDKTLKTSFLKLFASFWLSIHTAWASRCTYLS